MDLFQNFSDAPLVTVQIAAHDGDAHLLPRALASVDAQDFPPGQLQIVIAYDGEPSAKALALMEVEGVGRWLDLMYGEEKTGYYTVPRNRALLRCFGFYIAHLDADNWWKPGHLRGLLAAIRFPTPSRGWPHFVYSRREYVADEGCENPPVLGPSPLVEWEDGRGWLGTPKRNFIDTGDFLIGRATLMELAERSGTVWDSGLQRFGDWDLVRRLAEFGFRGQAVDQVLHVYMWTGRNLQMTRPVSSVMMLEPAAYERLRAQGLIRS